MPSAPPTARRCLRSTRRRPSPDDEAVSHRVLAVSSPSKALAIAKRRKAMKSYDVAECGAPLKLFERPTPKPTGSEVLLRVLAAGVCHSDLHIWEGVYDLGGGKQLKLTDRGMTLPLTMGHETVGEVVAMGPEAKGVKISERRLAYPWIGCGECKVCQRG